MTTPEDYSIHKTPLKTLVEGWDLSFSLRDRGYHARWGLLGEDGKDVIVPVPSSGNGVCCFANMLRAIAASGREPGFATFHIGDFSWPTPEECIRFLKLGQENGLYPRDANLEEVVETRVARVPLKDVGQARVYLYLCYARYVRDNPNLILNVLGLTEKHGVDFWPALAYSMFMSVATSQHSFLHINKNFVKAGEAKHPDIYLAVNPKSVWLLRNRARSQEPIGPVKLGDWAGGWSTSYIYGADSARMQNFTHLEKERESFRHLREAAEFISVHVLLKEKFRKSLEADNVDECLKQAKALSDSFLDESADKIRKKSFSEKIGLIPATISKALGAF